MTSLWCITPASGSTPPRARRALTAMAGALAPGGLLAFDVCDLAYGEVRRDAPSYCAATADWAIITGLARGWRTRSARRRSWRACA
jgi:hypothetical protein